MSNQSLIQSMSELKLADSKVSDLFIEDKKRHAILLVDRSGSTSTFAGIRENPHLTIFERMVQICSQLGHAEYRVVFWNSPSYSGGRFIGGLMALPFIVRSGALHTAFATAALAPGGGTCPSIGFSAIKPEWLVGDPMIYFVTDGQIGCSEMSDHENRRSLANEIRKLSCQLTIIAVENVVRDFNSVENVNMAAGGDIFKIVQEERLTGKVSRFVSYGPNGSFVQINKVRAPAGYAPYGDKFFSVLRVPEFMEYVNDELHANEANDEAKQLAIAQKLSATLEVLTRDRPTRLSNDIIRTFARMFTIDQDMVQYIMTGAIAQERGGQAQVFANYRAELKNLFAQADGLLKRDVCAALGMGGEFITPVIAGRVLVGSYRLAMATVNIHGVAYPRAGFSPTLPVLPLLTAGSRMSDLQDQCLRQWIRAIYASLYRVHPTADDIIYLLLGDMYRVCTCPSSSEKVKTSYRQFARCVLRKKRLNSMQTEMDRLMAGELPIPNSGRFDDFEGYMHKVSAEMGLFGTPLKMWYDICMALDPALAMCQMKHCLAFITNEEFKSSIQEDYVPESTAFDYSCIITLEDISPIGGFRIKPHVGVAGLCSPVYLISADGKRTMLTSGQCACPVCYKRLIDADFEAVGPKIPFNLPVSYNSIASVFTEAPVRARQPPQSQSQPPQSQPPQSQPPQSQPSGIRNANNVAGKLVVMKGVVGAGKSTTAATIKNAIEARGGVCLVEGTDKYCKSGMHIRDAVSQVTRELMKISTIANDDLVVVIDTCGEQSNARSPKAFNVDFEGWQYIEVYPNLDRKNMRGYFAWSLRNVLQRGAVGPASNYYLSPTSAGWVGCIYVHRKKAKALFKQSEFAFWQFDGATVATLNPLADAYAATLTPFVINF